MDAITVYHTADVRVTLPTGAPPAGDTVLARLVASMAPDSWALVDPQPANMDAVLFDQNSVAGGNDDGIIPYGGACNAGYICGGGHGGGVKFVHFDEATHAFVVLKEPDEGSHPYQHTWYPFKVLMGSSSLLKWDGGQWNKVADLPENTSQLIATALCVWRGQVIWYSGNSGILWALDEATGKWTQFAKHPNQSGVYQNVCHPTPSGIVFGGGHNSNNDWPGVRELYLSDGFGQARMQDAPYPVGIEAMQMTGDGKGRINLVGFGQCYGLNPATGVVSRRADPPPTMLQPNPRPGLAKNIMSWEGDGFCAYAQYDRGASPRTALHVYKPA